jgi:hypothetical protein
MGPASQRERLGTFAARLGVLLTLGVLLAVSGWAEPVVCARCHPHEVSGYSKFSMARSLRRADREPAGEFRNSAGTRFTVHSDGNGTWQRIEQAGHASVYKVAYAIGSGNHATGYLVRIADHLFQSPIAYYAERHSYDMAPGFEKVSEADLTRPVTEECLLCHSGKPRHISGSINRYETPEFEGEAISCERCHGPSALHLKRPVPGSIVNPAKLQGAPRDSICEQCHLSGLVRVLNPGETFADFTPGLNLEQVWTVYLSDLPSNSPQGPLKVISHPEQLAASACARNSAGRLWCGTCHDPHNKPAERVKYYRERCVSCHGGKLPLKHIQAEAGDCIACHMPRRKAFDGGHTVFTDHRIVRRAQAESTLSQASKLRSWRDPVPQYSKRNLALAYLNVGVQKHLPAWIVRGYRMLTELQTTFPDDPQILSGFGTALMEGKNACEAKFAFDRLVLLDPENAVNQENAGRADLGCGDISVAVSRLEKAVELDPLLLSAAEVLEATYTKTGDTTKQAALAGRIGAAMQSPSAARADAHKMR